MDRSKRCWMIAACLWIVSLGLPRMLVAQNLVAIVAGDISPSAHWGEYTAHVIMDVTNVAGMLGDNMPKMRLHTRSLRLEKDADSDPRILLGAIANLNIAPQDTLFFFYTGHGGSDDQGHFLALAQGHLYRKTLLAALAGKGARMTVLITDCCNTRSDGYRVVAPAYRSTYPAVPSELFRALFFEPRGLVDINSCAPGESAFFAPHNEETGGLPGSVFTKAFTSWMQTNQQHRRAWDELVREVSLQVHTDFHSFYPKGAQVAKGEAVQTEQTVYPIAYPGMPEKKGPRTGFVVRDFPGTGAVITSVEAGSPAAQVFLIADGSFAPLRPQQVIVSVNGQPVENIAQLVQALNTAPQIVRLGIRDARKGSFDILLRMRY